MEVPSISDVAESVAESAGECPGCGWSPEPGDLNRTVADHGDAYHDCTCGDCGGWRWGTGIGWLELAPPSE